MRGFPVGTVIQEKTGRVKVKTDERQWTSRGRHEYEKEHKIKLSGEQRVYHMDGDKANDDPYNLVAITFSGTVYTFSRSRVLFIPKAPKVVLPKATKVAVAV